MAGVVESSSVRRLWGSHWGRAHKWKYAKLYVASKYSVISVRLNSMNSSDFRKNGSIVKKLPKKISSVFASRQRQLIHSSEIETAKLMGVRVPTVLPNSPDLAISD